ncbi:MAG: UvrD-helicase domain-containing protein [Burkholderiales bacterium]
MVSCGKTTRLLEIMEEELARGVRPERLAFVSFTKKAVGEAATRAQTKFNLSARELPYFRTIHSLAYRLLGVTQGEIMQHKHWAELGSALGYTFSRHADMSDGMAPTGRERGDLLRFIEQLGRARCVGLEQQIRDSREEVTPQELARYMSTLAAYKRDTGVMDFTDLLERYVAEGQPAPVDVAIIDEAQDLSRLQWKLIKRAFAGVPRIYVAGDDDQAIFEWSGADVDTFLALKGEREILNVTHRLPRHLYGYSQMIVSRLSQRFEKKATPRAQQGELHRLADWQQAPIQEGGTWMLLARNSFLLGPVKEWLHGAGLPYATAFGSSVVPAHLRAIIAWEKLRKGEAQPAALVREVYDHMNVTRGHKTLPGVEADRMLTLAELRESHGCLTDAPWHDALTKIPLRDLTYYRAIKRRGESLARPPRIYVGTIHSVKGGEADNVALLPDMTQRTWEGYERERDAEHRTFYVGATRAKEALWLVAPSTTRSYTL